jgi:NADH-quinone oxidoreductase subunit K
MAPLEYYIMLSAILFGIGVWGVLKSRNAIVIFMSIELMLNAVNLSLVAFASNIKSVIIRLGSFPPDKIAEVLQTSVASGQVYVMLVMTVAAAEAAVGLGIIMSIFRAKESVNVDNVDIMKW